MKYSVGQKVKIRSLEWYRDNVNRYGIIECGKYEFFEPMNEYCGKVVTIKRIDDDNYRIDADKGAFCWSDEMIEGLVEDEMSLDKAGQITDFEYEGLAYTLPDGYQFVDENGNVINAMKIVLEKKKKEYPKTYEECCKVLSLGEDGKLYTKGYKASLIQGFQKLLICRDAYWKIAGEEMGLGKPWEPSYKKWNEYIDGGKLDKHTIIYDNNEIQRAMTGGTSYILTFPTEEMRDTFYENFKELIESCKELL